MLAEISVGLTGLKTALDLAKTLNATLNEAGIGQVRVELQSRIFDAQQALFAAQENEAASARRIADLEQEIVRLKDWSEERKNYELKTIEERSFAYMKKAGMDEGEPPHWLCASCFDQGHKSILQYQGEDPKQGRSGISTWLCQRCKGGFSTPFYAKPE